MKKLILFILATIVLISCNKKVTLKGRVLNPVTNQRIEGFTIVVSADTWELPAGAKPVGETTSDANGDFVLEFKKLGLSILATIVRIYFNKKVTLKGRVRHPVTNQGIEGFTIAVSADTWELPGGAKPVRETTSDAIEEFVLAFKKSGYDFSVYKE